MEYNESVIELIKSLEGYRANAYRDMNGVLTIGYGHTNATGINTFEEDSVYCPALFPRATLPEALLL